MNKGLLLGAGFSYDLGMPLAGEVTDVFLGMFSKKSAKRFAEILSRESPFSEDRPINKKAIFEGVDILLEYKVSERNNYEEFLSKLQGLGKLPGKTQSDRDSYHYLFSVFYDIIHNILTLYQIESYSTIYSKNLKWFSSLKNILSEEETWVFTLNHDLYMECLAVDLGIPVTYGDVGQIVFPVSNIDMENKITFTYSDRNSLTTESAGFFKNKSGINLVKLHGGLSELEYEGGKVICNQYLLKKNSLELMEDFKKIDDMAYYHQGRRVPSGRNRVITNSNGDLDIIEKSMLTGGAKYSLTTNVKKGEEKLKLFYDVLNNLDELTIIGYGFNDSHINHRISNGMVLNSDLKLRIVDPVHKPTPEFLRQFDYDSRIRGAVCGAPIWMDYSGNEQWNDDQMEGLKENEGFRQSIKNKVESNIWSQGKNS